MLKLYLNTINFKASEYKIRKQNDKKQKQELKKLLVQSQASWIKSAETRFIYNNVKTN